MAEQVDITTLALKVDATSARVAALELENLGKQAKKTGDATDEFVKSVERESAVLGKSRTQVIAMDAAKAGLSKTQMEQVKASMAAIDAHEKHERVMGQVRNAAGALGAALGISLGGIIAGYIALLAKATQAAGEAEQEQLRLAGALRATGHAAGLAAKDIKALADEMAGKTFFDDEGITRAASEMLVFRNVQGETFKEGIRLAADMAAQYGGEVRDSVKALGKALDDPVEGVTMLQRQFGPMNERLKAQIILLAESNKLGEAQAIVLDYVRGKVGGLAEAMNTGTIASTKNMKKEWNEMLEELGQTPARAAAAAGTIDILRTAIANLRKELAGEKNIFGDIKESMLDFMGLTGMAIRKLEEFLKKKGEAARAHTGANLMAGVTFADPAAGAAAQGEDQKDNTSFKAYKKLQELMKQTASDAKKEADAVQALRDAWKEMSVLDRVASGYKNVEEAVKALRSGMPIAKKAQEDFKQSLENVNKILDDANGKNGSYEKSMKDLKLVFESGKISAYDYALAFGFLVMTQTDAGKALTKLREEQKKLSQDALDKSNEEMAKRVQDAEKVAQTQEDELLKLQQGEAALYLKQAAYLAMTLAMEDASQQTEHYVTMVNKEIAALERAAAAARKQDAIKGIDKAEQEKLKQAHALIKAMQGEARRLGDILSESFGKGGSALAKMVDAMEDFATQSAKTSEEFGEAFKKAVEAGDLEKVFKLQEKYQEDNLKNSIKMYGDMAGAAKGFFKENSSGYKAMEAVEKAFRVAELAMATYNFVTQLSQVFGLFAAKKLTTSQQDAIDMGHTASSVTNSGIRASADGTGAIAKTLSSVPYPWNLVAAGTVLAALMAVGVKMSGSIGGGGSTPSVSAERQRTQGTGTVLGDKDAKSESIMNALEILRDNSSAELLFQSRMLVSLRAIESGIKGMATFIARNPALTGGGSLPANQGGGWWSGGNTFSVADAGISIALQTVAQAIDGISASGYRDITRQHTGRFGMNSYSATNRDPVELGEDFTRSLSLMVRNIADAVADAVSILTGASAATIRKMLADINISIESMSFHDLRGDDIQAALGAVFGTLGDQIVTSLRGMFSDNSLAALADFQQVGEGAFQTLIRVASGVESARATLALLNIRMIDWRDITDKQGEVTRELIRDSIVLAETLPIPLTRLATATGPVVTGVGQIIRAFDGTAEELVDLYIKLRDIQVSMRASGISAGLLDQAMVTAAGGITALQAGLSSYARNFFTAQEQIAFATGEVAAGFNRIKDPITNLNLQMPTTAEGMRAMVAHYTRMGDSATIGAIMALVPAWVDVQNAASDAAKEAHKSWMDVSDLLGQLNGETTAERDARHAGDYATQFTRANPQFAGMGFDQLIVKFQEMFKDEGTWAAMSEENKILIRAMLGLAVDMRGVSDAVRNMDPAYTTTAGDHTSRNLSEFQRRYGGIIGEQSTAAGSISLESNLVQEQMAANVRRQREIEQQYQGRLLPPEWQGLQTANNLYTERLRTLAGQLGLVTTLTAQYGQETGDALYELRNWYDEQRDLMSGNHVALLALDQLYAERRRDILEEAMREINQAFSEMQQWRAKLLTGDASPLTAQQRFDESRRQYEQARGPGLALNATAEQQARYREMADAYMREAISFRGRASSEYDAIFRQIIAETARFGPTGTSAAAMTASDTTPVLMEFRAEASADQVLLRGEVTALRTETANLQVELAEMKIAIVKAIVEELPIIMSSYREIA